jgi:hypothetical protein
MEEYKKRVQELEEQLEKQKEPLKKGKDAISAMEVYNRVYSDMITYLKPRQEHGRETRVPDALKQEISHALDRTAIHFPALNSQLGEAAAPYIDMDMRSYNLLDYYGIGLFYNKQYADARIIFHCAVRPSLEDQLADVIKQNDSKQNDKKETKETKQTNPKQPSETKPLLRRRIYVDDDDHDDNDKKTNDEHNEHNEHNEKYNKIWKQIVEITGVPSPASSGEYQWSIHDSVHANIKHIWENAQHPTNGLKQSPIFADEKIRVENPKPFRTFWKLIHETQWKSPRHLPNKYHIFNPCVIQHPTDKGKYLCNLRCGNYHMNMEKLGKASVYEYEGRVHTLNCLVTIDPYWRGDEFGNINKLNGVMIKEEPVPYPAHVAGCEDIRLIWNDDTKVLYAVFTSLEQDASGRPAICITTLDWKKGKFTSPVVRCKGPIADRIEKNWIGFVYNGKLYFIYSMNEIVVLEVNPSTGDTKFVSYDLCTRYNAWRGSSPPVYVNEHPTLLSILKSKIPNSQREQHCLNKDKWMLMLVHMSAFPQYSHRLVVFRLRPLPEKPEKAGRPFTLQALFMSEIGVFNAYDVEFTCTLQITPDSKEIMIPFAMRDEYAFCHRYCSESVFNSLKWIGSPDDLISFVSK